ncbi:hypothetical protein ACF06X_31705 [Streptomyces sp. NPDC015346]|uniref:hypothetical protein n=1 Tax=Streptomyces sp. NPDC015346 TaxID=3364954 RepID=UPI0036F5EFED
MTHPHAHRPSRPRRPGLSFAVVNGAALAAHLVLACFAADLLAASARGGTGIGLPALLLQAVLLVWTAARFDRRADDEPRQGGRRTAHEQGEYR